jgi:hypothetical protein
MQGEKQRVFKSHLDLSLEALVTQNNFYRQVQSKLDLDFVRELVAKCYIVTVHTVSAPGTYDIRGKCWRARQG